MRLLSAAQMREADRAAIEDLGIPAASLMEAAGLQVLEAMEQTWGSCKGRRVAVLCGKGNNGGDGYVIARHLARRGAAVSLLTLAAREQLSVDARLQADICIKSGIEIQPFNVEIAPVEWIVDAIFGTGFKGEVQGGAREAIAWINEQGAAVAAVDIPSGCDADTGAAQEFSVRAHLCVALASAKPGHWMHPAAEYCGQLIVKPIGIPVALLDKAEPRYSVCVENTARTLIPRRSVDAHKKNTGTVLVVVGSAQYPGAALLAVRAAFRAGAGYLHVVCPEQVVNHSVVSIPEAVFHPMGDTVLGENNLASILKLAQQADAVLVGPGLGCAPNTAALCQALYKQLERSAVFDADALHALATLESARPPVQRLLTPHAGEMAVLMSTEVAQLEKDRLKFASQLAVRLGADVLLKGPHSIAARPAGECSLNGSGNQVLASAGSGDVLSGLLVSLLAQGLSTFDAARLGAWLHGWAADEWRKKHGSAGMTASDLIELLPGAMEKLR